MAAADILASLTPECRALTQKVIADCAAAGLEFRPYFGARDPVTQAKLWRQSRSSATISAQMATLRGDGAPFLAQCILAAGPQNGPPVTGAIPGLSWHQYGQACDLVLVRNGVFDWDDAAAYAKFGGIVAAAKGKWGGDFGDNDHLQLFADEPLTHFKTMQAIDAEMKRLWPHVLGMTT